MPLAQPKEKLERRIGERLFLKGERSLSSKAAVVRRSYPPGMHGKKARRGRSEYAVTLHEKQKVRYLYGIDDKTLKRYYRKALTGRGRSTEAALAELLERRLDNVIFRLGFAVSRSQARHIVSYGHILVNDKPTRQPSYQIKIGDKLSVQERWRQSAFGQELTARLKKYAPPDWLEIDKDQKVGRVLRLPTLNDILTQQNMTLVSGYYSR